MKMCYEQLLDDLKAFAEEDFANFQERLIFTKSKILGVRTPTLRKLAKQYQKSVDELITFPNDYYEVVFIKLCVVSSLPYDKFLKYIDECAKIIDNWATCDSFKPTCLKQSKRNRDEFLPKLNELFTKGGEFYERLVLVLLLGYYLEEEYAPIIKQYIERANTENYYVHMAVAWLTAELLVKLPKLGEEILNSGRLPPKTHNKAIQKAIESFRITKQDKQRLLLLKIK